MALRILCVSNMYPGPDNPDYGSFVETMNRALQTEGHEVECVAIDTRSRGVVRTPGKYLTLARRALAPAKRADVIYAHYLFPTGAIAAAVGATTHKPWVITAHGRDVRNLDNPALRRLSAPAVAHASAVIAVSRRLADDLAASGLVLPPVYVAHMGVDLERFQPHDRAAARSRLGIRGGPVIVAVGGLTDRKNPLRLVQAVARLRERFPEVRLVFVGDGPLAGAIRVGAESMGLGEAVTLVGAVPNTEIVDWLAACDLLALPSLIEPLGVVALEAMASGRPVVATRVGGTAEVVGAAGRLVDPLNPIAIANGLAEVLDRPPTEQICRTAAIAHGVSRQARKVGTVLTRAVEQAAR